MMVTMMMMTIPMTKQWGGLVLKSWFSGSVLETHLLGAIVLDEGIKWYHTIDFQKHWRGAQLLLAWSTTEVAGGWAAAFLLTTDLYTWDELVIWQHLGGQETWEVGDEGHRLEFFLAAQLSGLWKGRDQISIAQKVRCLNHNLKEFLWVRRHW